MKIAKKIDKYFLMRTMSLGVGCWGLIWGTTEDLDGGGGLFYMVLMMYLCAIGYIEVKRRSEAGEG